MSGKTLGSAIAEDLRARGVDVVFGIPGVHNVELYRGLEQSGIHHVLARHEQGAGFMADGYARASGKPGVAFVITGPGVTNIMTPMGQAWSDSVPMLVISSCLPPESRIPGQLHQMRDQTGAGACVCDWSELACDAGQVFDLLDRAFAELESQRARPKHITVPIDMLGAPGERKTPAIPRVSEPTGAGGLAPLAGMINGARRPLFIFGGGAAGASDMARAVLDRSGAAAFTTYAGRGVVPASHPLNFGATLARPDSAQEIARADLVVVVGSELAQVDLWRDTLGHSGTLARIDIDQAVLDDAHGARIRIRARAETALAELVDLLEPSEARWDERKVAAARRAFRAQTEAERPGIAPFVDAMQAVLPARTPIYSDMTQFAYVAKEIYPLEAPGLWHHPFGFGTLGYALPAAIGGALAAPGQPVVAIAGDYGFQYTIQELGTAAELSLPLVIVLWDNGKLKEIEDCMVGAQISPNAVIARNPDFRLLAESYGIAYELAETPDQFATALGGALSRRAPALLHLRPAGVAAEA